MLLHKIKYTPNIENLLISKRQSLVLNFVVILKGESTTENQENQENQENRQQEENQENEESKEQEENQENHEYREQQEGQKNQLNQEYKDSQENREDEEQQESQEEQEDKENEENKKNKKKKITIGIIASLCTLLIIYGGISIYFMNHFYYGTEINAINLSGKTVAEAKEEMTSKLKKYTLNIKERGGKNEEIKADSIGLKYISDGQVEDLKSKQKPLKWISAFINTKDFKITEGVSYNKELLKERLDKLDCFDSKNVVEPKNPSFKYTDNAYMIVEEVNGNKVDKEALYDYVAKAIVNEENTIDLEAANCYVNPQYTSKSQKIIDTKNMLNKLVASKVTYNLGEKKEIVDSSKINNWLKVDENFSVTFDEEKVKSYLQGLFSTYNTVGKTRDFVTSSGTTTKVSGGDYGWQINTNKEIQDLIEAIKEGQTISKDPTYLATALTHNNNDIGNTYVEINMSSQHLWFYKNGSLIVEGNIVTGNVSNGHATPAGVYKLKYKERNSVLRGQDYAAPVSFWMPFNGGIGIHDASWRSEFGGSIYMTNGSHGCVNSPYYLAQAIYNNIQEGTPIVCFY